MEPCRPRRTARVAATLRAARQELDSGRVFRDPLAARSRLAEDALAAAVARHGG